LEALHLWYIASLEMDTLEAAPSSNGLFVSRLELVGILILFSLKYYQKIYSAANAKLPL